MDYHYDSTSSAAFDLITLSADAHSLVSLRCKPTLTALPPELLSRVGHNLSLCEYSCLSRTSKRFHGHLFRPSEIVLFLKTRYRLSIESGSIIIAYLANMQVKAPLLLEKIFDDFFADSVLHHQEEYLIKQQQQQQRELLSHNTYLLNQSITGSTELNSSAIALQRMNALHSHKSAEQARKQAKWDAVRMLGVLYALDKTHVGFGTTDKEYSYRIMEDDDDRPFDRNSSMDSFSDEETLPDVQSLRGRQMSPPLSRIPTHVPPTLSSVTASLEKKVAKSGQQILNRDDKIAFLTRYTDRMHTKLQALGIKDWGQKDIQTKKTYQLMIQHNNKTGEKDLVEFYLGRYGSAPPGDDPGTVTPAVLPTEV
ncbi:hypothetical protein BG000_007537 [Podila horticola]|nr:hypothetical protein BG000_007537 [Podila horticola]